MTHDSKTLARLHERERVLVACFLCFIPIKALVPFGMPPREPQLPQFRVQAQGKGSLREATCHLPWSHLSGGSEVQRGKGGVGGRRGKEVFFLFFFPVLFLEKIYALRKFRQYRNT